MRLETRVLFTSSEMMCAKDIIALLTAAGQSQQQVIDSQAQLCTVAKKLHCPFNETLLPLDSYKENSAT